MEFCVSKVLGKLVLFLWVCITCKIPKNYHISINGVHVWENLTENSEMPTAVQQNTRASGVVFTMSNMLVMSFTIAQMTFTFDTVILCHRNQVSSIMGSYYASLICLFKIRCTPCLIL